MYEEPGAIYSEVQRSRQWWIWAIIILDPIIIAVVYYYCFLPQLRDTKNPTGIYIGLGVGCTVIFAILILFACAKLITVVRTGGLYTKYFPFHWSFKQISLDDVETIEPVTYSPMKDYGGWGIRYGRSGKAYNPTGNRGVKITYKNGKHILIGSGKPEELAKAIEQMR